MAQTTQEERMINAPEGYYERRLREACKGFRGRKFSVCNNSDLFFRATVEFGGEGSYLLESTPDYCLRETGRVGCNNITEDVAKFNKMLAENLGLWESVKR
jgi:hypothetical protein